MTPLVPELFTEMALRHPEAPAVVSGQGGRTYRELAQAARRVAGGLAAGGPARSPLSAC